MANRIEAAKTLGTINDDESVNALIKAFDDDNPEVRLQASKVLLKSVIWQLNH